ncbi:MAG: transcriptional regulator, ArsR family [Sphingomonas bacterium]|uniref:ArsR/SmtB family transcription factor n=1 Tax=Sphingomonas bacterium TaxID=1895847 RepID=UPI0026032D39|nr:metalloregulator ArsR/SmtB family transcription factor [Sphingomonas bacterium]MDB5705688.1 transcriptional regulator, ArsR family [Sphingomonas bacterium]
MTSPADPAIQVERVLRALADPSRRAIVERLTNGPLSVSGLAAPLEITLTAVAQHLQVLEECGLVRTEKTGRVRTCSLETKGFSVLEQWIRDRRSPWEKRLDQLGEFLAQEE